MKSLLASVTLCVGLASTALSQEMGWNENYLRPSKIPATILQKAEKEGAGAKFTATYRDGEKRYRLIGKKGDGTWVSVRIDHDGALDRVRSWTVVPPSQVPKAVAGALQGEIRKPPSPRGGNDLGGFTPTRVWLVDEFVAREGKNATYYEYLGKTARNPYYTIRIGREGEVLGVAGVQLSPSSVQRQTFPPDTVAAVIRMNLEGLVPGVKLSRVVRVSVADHSGAGVNSYVKMYGRDRANRAVEAEVMGLSSITNLFEQVPVGDLPRPVAESVRKLAGDRPELKGFRAVEAKRVRWLGRDGLVTHQVFGDDAYGFPVVIDVDERMEATSSPDEREDWEVAVPETTSTGGVPPSGYSILAARYGHYGWIDATDLARASIPAGVLKVGGAGGLPDPSYGQRKAIVLLYSVDGKVGLATTPDGEDRKLGAEDDPSGLAEVPARGFAVLAARFGNAERWSDVTAAVRAKVEGGRLDTRVAEVALPDPSPSQILAIAYAEDGRVGLLLTPYSRRVSLPLAGPPLNSSALEVKKIEFPANVLDADFSQDGRLIALGVEEGSIRIIEAATGREVQRIDSHGPGRVAVAFTGPGNALLSGGADKVLRLWDLKTGKEKAIFRGHSGEIHRVALTPNGRLAASDSADRTIRLWDVAKAREVRKFEGHTDFVDGLAFAPDGKTLVSASWDGSARIWDAATGRELRRYQGDAGPIGAMALSADGRALLVGCQDRTARRADVATAREAAKYPTEGDSSQALAWLPDARRFLAADGTAVMLWDVASNRLAAKLERHIGKVRCIAVSPDGRRAVTGAEDRTARLWNLP